MCDQGNRRPWHVVNFSPEAADLIGEIIACILIVAVIALAVMA